MKYIIKEQLLTTDQNEPIKTIHCPLQKAWDELLPWAPAWNREASPLHRYCGDCRQTVVDVNSFSETQIQAVCSIRPDICIHLKYDHPDLEVIGDKPDTGQSPLKPCIDGELEIFGGSAEAWSGPCRAGQATTLEGLPIVRTGRSLVAIDEAIQRGYRAWFVPPRGSSNIWQKLSVYYAEDAHPAIADDARHQPGLVRANDYRWGGFIESNEAGGIIHQPGLPSSGICIKQDMRRDISPVAAYLLPQDLKPGTPVYLGDIIEDVAARSWNQGDNWRLESGIAIWTGVKMAVDEPEPHDFLG